MQGRIDKFIISHLFAKVNPPNENKPSFYNEENKDGLKVSLECFGVVENAIAKALPVGFRLYTLNESLTLMGNLPYQNRREVENTIKVMEYNASDEVKKRPDGSAIRAPAEA